MKQLKRNNIQQEDYINHGGRALDAQITFATVREETNEKLFTEEIESERGSTRTVENAIDSMMNHHNRRL